jgi:glucoamylase
MDLGSVQGSAFGWPGLEPRWTRGNKDGVGTAYSSSSRVWFTVWRGILTEVYYPTIDRPQLRDLQYLISDGEGLFHEEKRDLDPTVERLEPDVLGYRVTSADPAGRYRLVKEIIADPYLPCVLVHTRLEGDEDLLTRLRLHALCAPHLEVGGWHNNAQVVEVAGRRLLAAEKRGTWLVLGATVPFARLSCGYVGASDGWTDLAADRRMDFAFATAPDGNVALTGELGLDGARELTLGLGFGDGLHAAATALLEGLGVPFAEHRSRYVEQWRRPCSRLLPLERAAGDGGRLYRSSALVLLAHEDKTFPGALIASLSIPWGEATGDDNTGGYHLVWTRDMVNSATGLLAAGHAATARQALVYLAVSQQDDGGFPQNFLLDGTPHWTGVQLDEVSFPVLLAWRLHRDGELADVDPYPMVVRAAAYLLRHGPATGQERWEEASGLSPSTLAVNIAALVCAAGFARLHGDEPTASFLEDYADFLEGHVEAWTVTTEGTLLPGRPRHYIRINPNAADTAHPDEDPNTGLLGLANRPPGSQWQFPAKEIVDAGFLELVRYGIRRPDDPVVVDSLAVVDALLRVDTPAGPCFRRYNHDGYGQRPDGGPYVGWGQGRAWPLLSGERGHYELAAGGDPTRYLRAMEGLASPGDLLPEQVWDAADLPGQYLRLGGPTGSAMPLAWAHAEYLKLLRSTVDGRVFDQLPEVADRYRGDRRARRRLEVWKHNRQVRRVAGGQTLRVQASEPFRLRWSRDGWGTARDTTSSPTAVGVHYADIELPAAEQPPLRFTFFWPERGRWEGSDYQVAVATIPPG